MIKLYYDIFVIVIIFSFFFSSFFFFFTEITQCRDKYLFRFEFISFDRMKKKKEIEVFFSFEKEWNDVNLFDLRYQFYLFVDREYLWEKNLTLTLIIGRVRKVCESDRKESFIKDISRFL